MTLLLVTILTLGLALAAIALLLVRGKTEPAHPFDAGLIAALAGGLIGASLSVLLGRRLDPSTVEVIRELLARTVDSALTAPENEVAPLRMRWHHYHVTLIDHRRTWRYTHMPLDNNSVVGALMTTVPVVDSIDSRAHHSYRIDAATWGSRFILFQTRVEGDEAATAELFPEMRAFQHVHAGVAIMESWDAEDILTPVILSRDPLIDVEQEGTVSNPEHAVRLDEIWQQYFSKVRSQLPSLDQSTLAMEGAGAQPSNKSHSHRLLDRLRRSRL